jgi:hypothetical protein
LWLSQLTIASKNEELVVVAHLVDHNIGVGRDNLLLGRQLGALLELEIANGSRQRQVSVHAAKVDKSTRSCDSRLFAYKHAQKRRHQLATAKDTRGVC